MCQQLSLNISIGRSCFVQCRGCYNHFGELSIPLGDKVIIAFLARARDFGVKSVTLCGGDPLSRPRVLDLVVQIKKLGYYIKLDTLGTPIIGNARTIFFGRNEVVGIDAKKLSCCVDLLGIPIDGTTEKTIAAFRAGRPGLLGEQFEIIQKLEEYGARVCINTVAHRGNLSEIVEIPKLISAYCCIKNWQIFQFSPTGPLGFKTRKNFMISDLQFEGLKRAVLLSAHGYVFGGDVEFKSNSERDRAYLLVDSDGIAWFPKDYMGSSERVVLGDINQVGDVERILNLVSNPEVKRDSSSY